MTSIEVQLLQLKRKIKETYLPENVKKIKEFDDENASNSLSLATRRNYLESLYWFGKRVKKPFGKIKKEDMIEAFKEMDGYTESSIATRKCHVKRFFKFLNGGEEFPQSVKFLKIKRSKNGTMPEQLVTEKEILKMIEATNHPRDACVIAILYDGALRVSELTNLQIKHVEFDDYGARIHVQGKSGRRVVRLINSVPYLKTWLNNYPKKKPNSYVVKNLGSWRKAKSDKWTVERIVKSAGERSGINKRIYPHLLRHSRLTELAKVLTPAELCAFAGWTQGSRQMQTYIHLSSVDIDRKLVMKELGKDIKKARKESVLKPRTCPRCGKENSVTNKLCERCWLPLDVKTAMDFDTEKDQILNLSIKQLLSDPSKAKELGKLIDNLQIMREKLVK